VINCDGTNDLQYQYHTVKIENLAGALESPLPLRSIGGFFFVTYGIISWGDAVARAIFLVRVSGSE